MDSIRREFFDMIDWPLLAKQKEALVRVVFEATTGEEKELLDGLVNMIDAMQDIAEVQGLWSAPEENEEQTAEKCASQGCDTCRIYLVENPAGTVTPAGDVHG